ncbi:MAG: tRNA pseudouridine(38-40) synthase TruA [Elusimicrobiota bacterium]
MHVKAVVEYDGTNYFGWQIQPKLPTVQNDIQFALKKLFQKDIEVMYSSRTDRGVHARGQVIKFETPFSLPCMRIKNALNGILCKDIIIKHISECSPEFNPRFDPISKKYIYRILNQKDNDYILKNFVWHLPVDLNFKKIESGLRIFRGEHDFFLFSSPEEGKNTIIEIINAGLEIKNSLVEIKIQAPYFLTHMVRYIVGYLVGLGKGKVSVEKLKKMLKAQGKRCTFCAPPQGLELNKVIFK